MSDSSWNHHNHESEGFLNPGHVQGQSQNGADGSPLYTLTQGASGSDDGPDESESELDSQKSSRRLGFTFRRRKKSAVADPLMPYAAINSIDERRVSDGDSDDNGVDHFDAANDSEDAAADSRRGLLGGLLASRQGRVGMAALLSLVILVTVLVVNRTRVFQGSGTETSEESGDGAFLADNAVDKDKLNSSVNGVPHPRAALVNKIPADKDSKTSNEPNPPTPPKDSGKLDASKLVSAGPPGKTEEPAETAPKAETTPTPPIPTPAESANELAGRPASLESTPGGDLLANAKIDFPDDADPKEVGKEPGRKEGEPHRDTVTTDQSLTAAAAVETVAPNATPPPNAVDETEKAKIDTTAAAVATPISTASTPSTGEAAGAPPGTPPPVVTVTPSAETAVTDAVAPPTAAEPAPKPEVAEPATASPTPSTTTTTPATNSATPTVEPLIPPTSEVGVGAGAAGGTVVETTPPTAAKEAPPTAQPNTTAETPAPAASVSVETAPAVAAPTPSPPSVEPATPTPGPATDQGPKPEPPTGQTDAATVVPMPTLTPPSASNEATPMPPTPESLNPAPATTPTPIPSPAAPAEPAASTPEATTPALPSSEKEPAPEAPKPVETPAPIFKPTDDPTSKAPATSDANTNTNVVKIPTAGRNRLIDIDDRHSPEPPVAKNEPQFVDVTPSRSSSIVNPDRDATSNDSTGNGKQLTTAEDEPTPVTDLATPHTVQRGENLWTISRLYYGYGWYYKALWSSNKTIVPAYDKLYVGQTIRIPPPQELDKALVAEARSEFESDRKARALASKLSKGKEKDVSSLTNRPLRQASQSADLDVEGASAASVTGRRLEPGEKGVSLPTTDPLDSRSRADDSQGTVATRREGDEADSFADRSSTASTRKRGPRYKIGPHDTLRTIARDTLGNSRRDQEIYKLNEAVIDDPLHLVSGQIIELPPDAKVVARRR